MLGEPEKQFSLTRAGLSTRGAQKQFFINRLSLFFNARNLTNSRLYQDRFGFQTPAYSKAYQGADYGAKLSAGIRGRF